MSNKEVPFYTQAAILDRYIHSSDPGADPDVLEIIIEMLRSRPDLRAYFLRSRPNAAWAAVLWDWGFFESSPSPQETEVGYALPRWDVQEYLISVADQVPAIVIKHVESVQGHAWYISQAIRALCYIPAEEVEQVVPRIVEWLEDPRLAEAIAPQIYDLIVVLAQAGHPAAFSLFRALTAPLPAPDVKRTGSLAWGAEAVSKFSGAWNEDRVLSDGLELLKALDIQRVVAILEGHLCSAIRLEASATDSPQFEISSWWRTAVEDTGQDSDREYKDKLLKALRDSLEDRVQQDAVAAEPVVERYLSEPREILRRLGLHILHRFPAEYRSYVVRELGNMENLDDVGIHHEFFMLLQRGYPYLETSDQEALIAAICRGPSKEHVQQFANWAKEDEADPEEYIEQHSKAWIRDRLWMLKDHLVGQQKQLLDQLVDELGVPEHPEFTQWTTGAFTVRDVSPISDQEIARMSPDELVGFLKQWQADADQEFGPERISYTGLANVVASVIVTNPQKYADHLTIIALHQPEFADALLDQFTKDEQASFARWELSINLCEQLLANDTVREAMRPTSDGEWVSVRQSIVRLLQAGLTAAERAIPAEHLTRVRDLLLILVDDPDPDPKNDRPAEGWVGHDDPATVAINSVRPRALMVLIEYARFKVKLAEEAVQTTDTEGLAPRRLEEVVRETLTRKLNRQEDQSWAVHSVYGHYLPLLYWLDQEWVVAHIDQIFPEDDDEQSVWFYAAAWDSFVAFNQFYRPLSELLRPKYERAIYNLSRGYVTQTHFRPQQGLGIHIVLVYLLSDYDLRSPIGQQSLIAAFFQQAPPEGRGNAVWGLWRICQDNPDDLARYWPRVRALWEWRVHEASVANHSTDFDAEMKWFARLPLVAPEEETVASLWPLLEGLLPHVTRSAQRDMGWDSLEKFVTREVDRDPVRAIQFYRLMYDHAVLPGWVLYPRDEARKIIETAAAHKDSRPDALSLIDLLARSGAYDPYRDVYERYAR